MLSQLLTNGLVAGFAYAVMATGFALTYNTTRIFHVAFGATYVVTIYVCYLGFARLQWGLWLSLSCALIVGTGLGVLVERFLYRPLQRRNASLLVVLIGSLGFYIVTVNLIAMAFGNETLVLSPTAAKTFRAGHVVVTSAQLAQLLAGLILLPAVTVILRYSHLGRCIRAARDDPALLETLGISMNSVRGRVFALGSLLTGIAALAIGFDTGIDPNIGMPALLTAAAALIVGGVGTFEGAAVGGLLLGVLQAVVVWKASSRWTDAATFVILIGFLSFRPQGILGVRRRVEEEAS
jgi:branched-chain amino acid transport system permease protein